VLPGGYPRNARLTFVDLDIGDPEARCVLQSHLIDDKAYKALASDDFEMFIQLREAAILRLEETFLSSYGLTIDQTASRSDEEIDADQ
jgi:hypothetical protein